MSVPQDDVEAEYQEALADAIAVRHYWEEYNCQRFELPIQKPERNS